MAAALGLAALFWWPLVLGGGLVGGDTYRYFLPQKIVYSEHLQRHELPTWNERVGNGYPVIGESQTGVFYPPNLLLYSLLSVNAAYDANFLLHYVLTFVFTWMYARTIGLSAWASGLAALVYTYGWFPPRSCLEWAILGGAWFPAALWCCERFLATRRWRFTYALCGVLTLQLLTGHFNLAFLTQLTLIPYVALRLFFANRDLPRATPTQARRTFGLSLAAVACAFALSAAQIAPTWELKRLSQRETPGPEHNLAAGAVPVWYWSQMIRPWYWYGLGTDRQAALDTSKGELGGRTNPVEAHLFFGMVPLTLALAGIVISLWTRDRVGLVWFGLGTAALLYTTGWFVRIGAHLPGFNFFAAPGRFGLITTLAAGVLAAKALDRLRATGSIVLSLAVVASFVAAMFTGLTLTSEGQAVTQLNGTPSPFATGGLVITDTMIAGLLLAGVVAILASLIAGKLARDAAASSSAAWARRTLTACVLIAPTLEFWLVCRVVSDGDMVADPPIRYLNDSPVGHILADAGGTARVLAPVPNVATMLDTSATPVYLTFGPAAYVDPRLTMPTDSLPKQIDWLRRAGVTHVLSFDPLNGSEWPVKLVWRGIDRFLNGAWTRYEPLYLYELAGTRGRIAWERPGPQQTAKITEFHSSRIVAEASSPAGGRLVLTDLAYPGWTATIDGEPAEAQTVDGMFRAVDLRAGLHSVVWSYRPHSLYWGLAASGVTFLFLAAVALARSWHFGRLKDSGSVRSR